MEVESRRITDDDEVDVSAFEETTYAFYEFVKIGDMSEGIVSHSGLAGGVLQEAAAGSGHFGAAHADELNAVTALFEGAYKACAVGVCARLCSAYENAVCFVWFGHK